jgi:hypothetical protein
MEIQYQNPGTEPAPAERRVYALFLKILIAYFATCSLTIPFVNRLWLGELPLLAVIQLPKLLPAKWVRIGVVMPAIRRLGLSRGSFSPDYIMARPYALAITYLVPLIVVVAVVGLRTRMTRPFARLIAILLALAAVDYALTLLLADAAGLTMY